MDSSWCTKRAAKLELGHAQMAETGTCPSFEGYSLFLESSLQKLLRILRSLQNTDKVTKAASLNDRQNNGLLDPRHAASLAWGASAIPLDGNAGLSATFQGLTLGGNHLALAWKLCNFDRSAPQRSGLPAYFPNKSTHGGSDSTQSAWFMKIILSWFILTL